MNPVLIALLVTFSLLMTIQAAYTLYLMLYTWDQQTSYEDALAPRTFRPQHHSFTVLLPARHEEAVIGRTIERVMQANYPRRLIEALVVCEVNDTGTIAAAQEAITKLAAQGITGVRVITFDDGPINKPHGLNKGLAQARHDVVTIFDAEDEIHPDIFHVVNTIMLNEGVRVVQSGVQLMNYNSTWFSAHNVLEYYFWFKSRLHVHAKNGMTPLGGNTVFFATDLIREIGGWDEKNLTEDADIGIRLSVRGERVRVVYDDVYVTREETPPDLQSFVKQRTRWNQGFLQTLRKGDWRHVPRRSNRFMAAYILAFPFIQALLGAYVPVSLAMMLWVKLPVLITIPLLLPGYVLLAHYLITTVGLYEFARSHQLRLPRFWGLTALHLFVTYFPYQWVLALAAGKALWRELRGVTNWEKTAHVGAHRDLAPAVSFATPIAVAAEEVLTEVMQAEAAVVSEVTEKLHRARPSRLVRSRALAAWMVGPLLCASLLGPLTWGIGGMAKSLGSAVPLPALKHALALAAPTINFGKLPPSGRTATPSISRRAHQRFGPAAPVISDRSQDSLVADHITSLPNVQIPQATRSPQHLFGVARKTRVPLARAGRPTSRPRQQVSTLHVGTTRSNLPRGSRHATAQGFAAPSHAVPRPIIVVSRPVAPVVVAAPPARNPAAPQTPARPTARRPVPVLVSHAAPPSARPAPTHPAVPAIAVQAQLPHAAAPPPVRRALPSAPRPQHPAPPPAHPSSPAAAPSPSQTHHGGPPPAHRGAPHPAPAPRPAAPPQPAGPPPGHHKHAPPPSQPSAPQSPPPAPLPTAKQPASPAHPAPAKPPAPQPAPAKQPASQPPPAPPGPAQQQPQPAPPGPAQQSGPQRGRGGQPPQPAPTPAAPAPNPAPPQPGQPPAPSPGGHGKGHP